MTTEDTGGLVDNENLGSGPENGAKQEIDTRETKTIEVRVDATPAERPEGLPDDFWDTDTNSIKTSALLDGYRNEAKQKADLRKQISKGKPESPKSAEDYKIEYDEETSKSIPEGDTTTELFKIAAHKYGLTQEQAQGVAADVRAAIAAHNKEHGGEPPMTAEQIAADDEKFRTEQKAILGDEGIRVMDALTARVAALYNKGSLNDDDKAAFINAAYDAKGVQFLQKWTSLAHDATSFIPSTNVINEDMATREQLDAMAGDARMSEASFRAKRTAGYIALESRGALK